MTDEQKNIPSGAFNSDGSTSVAQGAPAGELDCQLCHNFDGGGCKYGRRLKFLDNGTLWPLGTSGHPQPPRYCTARVPQ